MISKRAWLHRVNHVCGELGDPSTDSFNSGTIFVTDAAWDTSTRSVPHLTTAMPGRVMGEAVVVPGAILNSEGQLRAWLEKSFGYVKLFPPKEEKSKGER
jgi:hypothetical protein